MELIHNFDEFVERRGTDAKKYNQYPADVLPMWIADTDFKCPQPVIDAMMERMQEGVYGYTFNSERLKAAGARWQKVRFGWDVDPSWVEYSPGVIGGVICAVRAFSQPGDNIVIQTPCYPPFKDLSDHNGRHLLRNALVNVDGRFEINWEELETMLADARTKIFILCNPQNPTGRVFSLEELTRMGNLCLKHNVMVIADEIHQDVVYSGHKHIPFASICKEFADITVSLMNPSKTFNVPGLRTAAFIASNPVLKSGVHEMLVNNKAIGENIFGSIAFYTAYEQCDYYADQIVAYLEKNRDLVEKTLADVPGVKVTHAEGTYLLWLDCRGLGFKTQAELDSWLVGTAKLGFNSGTSFGPEGFGFVRMNIAAPKSTVEEALNRFINAVKAL